ncbi:hypothetical protein TNCV_4695821 [Trichonephila clavipes]|nr:hypothetical protein TNCV_4695821 [Trichonephila clavipes]
MALYAISQGRQVVFPQFRHGKRPMNMNHYTNAELVDINFIYCLTIGNGRAAFRLYGEPYSSSRQPGASGPGSFRATTESTGRQQAVRTPLFQEGVLHAVDQNLGTGVRALVVATPGIFEQIRQSISR